jgi:hypothetical protein
VIELRVFKVDGRWRSEVFADGVKVYSALFEFSREAAMRRAAEWIAEMAA